jgi:hypothetical protein
VELGVLLLAIWIKNYSVYRKRKLWAATKRAGEDVGREQVARIMRQLGICGASRATKRFTTHADATHVRSPDLVSRNFTAPRRAVGCRLHLLLDVVRRRLRRLRHRRLLPPDLGLEGESVHDR